MDASQQARPAQRAPLPSRVIAYLIDGFLFSILSPLFAALVSSALGLKVEHKAGPISTAFPELGDSSRAALRTFETFAVGSLGDAKGGYSATIVAVVLASFVVAYFQPGKTAMDLKIVESTGREARMDRKFMRGLLRSLIAPLVLLDLIFLTCVGDRSVEDYFLGTRVVYVSTG